MLIIASGMGGLVALGVLALVIWASAICAVIAAVVGWRALRSPVSWPRMGVAAALLAVPYVLAPALLGSEGLEILLMLLAGESYEFAGPVPFVNPGVALCLLVAAVGRVGADLSRKRGRPAP